MKSSIGDCRGRGILCLLMLLGVLAGFPQMGNAETVEQIVQKLADDAGGLQGEKVLVWKDNFFNGKHEQTTPFADTLSKELAGAIGDLGAEPIIDLPQSRTEPFYRLSGVYSLKDGKRVELTLKLQENRRAQGDGPVVVSGPVQVEGDWDFTTVVASRTSAVKALVAKVLTGAEQEKEMLSLSVVLPVQNDQPTRKLGGRIYADICSLLKNKYPAIKRSKGASISLVTTYSLDKTSNLVTLGMSLKGGEKDVSASKTFPYSSLSKELLQLEIIGKRKICVALDNACSFPSASQGILQNHVVELLSTIIEKHGVVSTPDIDYRCPGRGIPSEYHIQVRTCFSSTELSPSPRFPNREMVKQRLQVSVSNSRGDLLGAPQVTSFAGLQPINGEILPELLSEQWERDTRELFLNQLIRLDLHEL